MAATLLASLASAGLQGSGSSSSPGGPVSQSGKGGDLSFQSGDFGSSKQTNWIMLAALVVIVALIVRSK